MLRHRTTHKILDELTGRGINWLTLRQRASIPAPDLRAGIPVPESVRRIRDSSV